MGLISTMWEETAKIYGNAPPIQPEKLSNDELIHEFEIRMGPNESVISAYKCGWEIQLLREEILKRMVGQRNLC